jgi:hypothetical protein
VVVPLKFWWITKKYIILCHWFVGPLENKITKIGFLDGQTLEALLKAKTILDAP